MKVKSFSRVRLFATPWTAAYQAPPSTGFPRQNTGVGCHFLLQGIFLTQETNSGLPHCRQILYRLSYKGSPGTIRGPGKFPGEGNGNPLQYFAWKIPWMEESGGLQSMGSQSRTRLRDFTFLLDGEGFMG